nr:hypothetical protein [Tanacetum cinerariifolium]
MQSTSAVNTAMTAMFKQFQSNPPPAQVKAVEEICVTCGGSGTLPGNIIANPKGELKAITTRLLNPEEDECVEETYTDPDHAEYNIKVPPLPPVQNLSLQFKETLFCILGTLFHRVSRIPPEC